MCYGVSPKLSRFAAAPPNGCGNVSDEKSSDKASELFYCLSGYVRLYDLVNVIYNGILNYALEGEKTEEFRENWIRYVDERDYPDGLLSSVFRSEIIEKYLELDNRYDTRWAFTRRILL